ATFTYQVKVLDSVEPNQELKSTVSAQWFSLKKGSNTHVRRYNDEENKIAEASTTTSIRSADTNTLTISSTDTCDSSEYIRIGDMITYTATINLQKGTTKN